MMVYLFMHCYILDPFHFISNSYVLLFIKRPWFNSHNYQNRWEVISSIYSLSDLCKHHRNGFSSCHFSCQIMVVAAIFINSFFVVINTFYLKCPMFLIFRKMSRQSIHSCYTNPNYTESCREEVIRFSFLCSFSQFHQNLNFH